MNYLGMETLELIIIRPFPELDGVVSTNPLVTSAVSKWAEKEKFGGMTKNNGLIVVNSIRAKKIFRSCSMCRPYHCW